MSVDMLPRVERPGRVTAGLARLTAGIGPTPLASLTMTVAGRRVGVRLKLEGAGPWGSIKDRTALSLLRSVASRLEDPGAVLVESTSGNLGVALASVAAELGLRFVAVTDPNMSPVLAERLMALGAEVIRVSEPDRQGGYLAARLTLVRELTSADPAMVWTDQYHNPANPMAHYQGTAPELNRQAHGVLDAVFVAVSTGGTLAGIGRYLRQRRPDVRVVAVDVPGSRVFAEPTGSRLLTGIGASQASSFLRAGDWDEVVIVDDVAAIAHCHALAGALGLRLGGSGGAVLAGCARYVALHPEIRFPVCLCPDSGDNYTRTLYEPAWLARRGVKLSSELLKPTAHHPPVAFSRPDLT
jgi:2,3-diaminopropionate biosynthesis protein SbnA